MSDKANPSKLRPSFPKGVSGNPSGRPRGLERLVRDTVGDNMVAIIQAQASIAQGKKPEGLTDLPTIKASDMTKAAEWIGDRGWGKARQQVDLSGDLSGGPRIDYSKLTDDELDKLLEADELAARAAADDLGEINGDVDPADAPDPDGPRAEG